MYKVNTKCKESNDNEKIKKKSKKKSTLASPRNMHSYLPPRLQGYVVHYHDDFFLSPHFDPSLVAELMYEGYLPIATRAGGFPDKTEHYLLPKLHAERCVLYLPNIHVSRSSRKKSRHYVLKLNKNFDGVVEGCHSQHGIPWLYPVMVQALKSMNTAAGKALKAKVHSIELYKKRDNTESDVSKELELVSGELGYTVNNQIYTSLTGFYTESGSGTIQLLALAGLLKLHDYKLWDLGMEMDYKKKLGAICLPRDEFLKEFTKFRDDTPTNGVSLTNAMDESNNAINGYDAKSLIGLLKNN